VHHTTKIGFCSSIRGAVVICKIKMGDAQVKGCANNIPGHIEIVHIPKVVPQSEGNGREQHSAVTTTLVAHLVVALLCWLVSTFDVHVS